MVLPMWVISALEANRLLHKDCKAYLAHVIDTSTLEVTLERVPIVRKFSNVFSKDLQGLPPYREMKFGFDLLLGSTPIFIPL